VFSSDRYANVIASDACNYLDAAAEKIRVDE
jgi:hypothetical protein